MKTYTIKTERDKKLSRNINKVKKAIRELESMNLKIAVDNDVETMFGSLVDNIYVRDFFGDKIVLQKHLFTINK
jgi:hypothetical protein